MNFQKIIIYQTIQLMNHLNLEKKSWVEVNDDARGTDNTNS